MIPTLIVDDNKHNRAILVKLITEYCPDIKIIGEASSVETAEAAIRKLNPELIFLDIDLGDGTAFELLGKVPDSKHHIVFVTAFDKFAIEAFKVNAIDYLLKPISISDLEQSVEKVKRYKKTINYEKLLQDLLNSREREVNQNKRIVISSQSGLKFVESLNIIRCEADGRYTKIVLLDKSTLLSSKNLKEFEDELPHDLFFRVHHSHLINIKQVDQYYRNDDLIIMSNGDKIPLAQRKKNEFMDTLTII
ncbi:MAG: response regulator transcription factor [Bacteroidetes bacterium]|nr:response regulator transcription factor [Bacteroidota bacterium]